MEEDVAAGRATAEEIVTENALADDAAAFDEAAMTTATMSKHLPAEAEARMPRRPNRGDRR